MKRNGYSPFHKTFQYLCLQEQRAHKRNLKTVKSTEQSNLRVKTRGVPSQQIPSTVSSSLRRNCNSHSLRSQSSEGNFCTYKSEILKEPMVIHKNRPFEQEWNRKRIKENRRIAHSLMNKSCSVLTRDESIRDYYENHKKYEEFSRVYCSDYARRKDLLKLSSNLSFVSGFNPEYSVSHQKYITLDRKHPKSRKSSVGNVL